MKVEIKDEVSQEEFKYPFIGISTFYKEIVLFSECGKGTLLSSGITVANIGAYSVGWNMSGFKKYTGEITLSND